MNKLYLNHHYSTLLYKYKIFYIKFIKSCKDGSFYKLSLSKRNLVVNRLKKFRSKIEKMHKGVRVGAVASLASLALATTPVKAQSSKYFEALFEVPSSNDAKQRNPVVAADHNGDYVVGMAR